MPSSPPAGAAAVSSSPPKPLPVLTCDNCRVRKVRCNPGPRGEAGESEGAGVGGAQRRPPRACRNCERRAEKCTYDYQPKKPGRPRAPTNSRRPRLRNTTSSHSTATLSPVANGAAAVTSPPSPSSSHMGSGVSAPVPLPVPDDTFGGMMLPSPSASSPHLGPSVGSIFGSARQTLQSISFDHPLPRPGAGTPSGAAAPPFPTPTGGEPPLISVPNAAAALDLPRFDYSLSPGEQSSVSSVGPSTAAAVGTVPLRGSGTMADLASAAERAIPAPLGLPSGQDSRLDVGRIESFAPWEDIGFFLSIHMKHQHMLVPLVHRPTFAHEVLHRRDEHDEAFRGLLLSMVAYTICQCPLNWLLPRMNKPALELLLRRCQRGSRVIQIRHQTRPSLIVLASTIMSWITSQAAPAPELSANLMADVRRLVYTLGLNREAPRQGLSPVELEQCRRLFWEAYAIDKTNALNGHPINLLDSDGLPPFPVEIDDEYMAPYADTLTDIQPEAWSSYIVGFNAIGRAFRVLCGCMVRHRIFVSEDPTAGPGPDALLAWVHAARAELHAILDGLPLSLQPDYAHGPGAQNVYHTVFGTQAANIYITALVVELAVLDLHSRLVPGDQDEVERERIAIARRAFSRLEHTPVECLASNGESMVLRIILALLTPGPKSDLGVPSACAAGLDGPADEPDLGDGLWDWWNIYSRVQFVQLMPEIRS